MAGRTAVLEEISRKSLGREAKVWVFMPAGAQAGPSGRPQCTERLDLREDPRTKEAAEADIGFGIELKGPDRAMRAGWKPEWINSVPYTVHMGNEDCSVLFEAEQDGNHEAIDAFWTTVEWLSKLEPKPLSIGLHGGKPNLPPVELNAGRYNWRIPAESFIALQDWHGRLVERIRGDYGLNPAIETVSPSQFVGPPIYGAKAVWAPLTYAEARIGASPEDLLWMRRHYGSEIWVDVEHLSFYLNFVNWDENYEWMSDFWRSNWTRHRKYHESVGRFGYAIEIGVPPMVGRAVDRDETFERLIRDGQVTHLHVGGSGAEVEKIGPGEPEPPVEYIEGLKQLLAPFPGMFEETVGRRVGSHASIDRGDEALRNQIDVALANGVSTFLVETSGHTPNDCWYWARPDALEHSFFELLGMMTELV